MRILLWHGYLLGGTGSNVYTRALATRVEPRRPRRDRRSARSVTRSATTSAAPGSSCPELPGAAAAGVRARPLRGARGAAPAPGLHPGRARRIRRGERGGAARRCCPPTSCSRTTSCSAAPSAPRAGAPFVVKAHGSELEYSMRGNGPARARGRPRRSRGADAVYVGSAHIREVLEDVVGHVDRVHEVPPGVDVDDFRPGAARRGARRACSRRRAATRRTPANADERLPDEGNAARLRRASSRRSEPTVLYFGKLIENKGVHVLLEALAGLDARAVIVGFGDYRAELEALAPPGTLFTGPLEHRHLVQPAAALRRLRRALDLPGGVRDGRRRGRRRRRAAARRRPLRPRRGRRRDRRGATVRRLRTSSRSRPATRMRCANGSRAARARACRARALGLACPPRGRGSLELGGRRRASARLRRVAPVRGGGHFRKSGWALVAILGGTFMLLVDVTIVQVALPSIERDLHAGFAGLQWVIDAYTLTLSALLLSAGTLADRFSRKSVFLGGLPSSPSRRSGAASPAARWCSTSRGPSRGSAARRCSRRRSP